MMLPEDDDAALADFEAADDATLWRVAQVQLNAEDEEEIHTLLDLQNTGEITPSEYERLHALVDMCGELMVQKARAYMFLARRGYRVPFQKEDEI